MAIPNFNQTEIALNITLEAIKFNHNPNSATTDAFNIRKNETDFVIIPEWRQGISVKPEDSPAAYARNAINGCISIKAKFSCSDLTVSNISVQAIDGQGGNASALGQVQPTRVTLVNGESDFVLMTLNSPRFAGAGVGAYDITWHWQFSHNSSGWIDFATTTHRIYIVLAMPTAPWQPYSSDFSNTQQPWTEVLDFACCWAWSATTIPQAATLITHQVNDLGSKLNLVHYDSDHSGSTGFTLDDPATFDCTDFLLLIRKQQNQDGSGVNCDDCAAFVASFANILGCGLVERQMELDFPVNPHLRIGESALTENRRFSHHTVAWTGAGEEDDYVFDACVQLDSDSCPASPPHPLFLPANLRFGKLDEKLYRFRLTSNPDECKPVGGLLYRRIGPVRLSSDPIAISAIQDVNNKNKSRKEIEQFSLLLSDLSAGKVLSEWQFENLDFILDTDSLVYVRLFLRNREIADATLRVDAYASPSALAANTKLKKILARFQLLDIKRTKDLGFGDIVHTVPTRFVIVFIRREFVFRIRNVGKKVVSSESAAREIDDFIISL